MKPVSYDIVLSEQTLKDILSYKADIAGGVVTPGARLKNQLAAVVPPLSTERFIECLLATKQPRIFAESEIRCDGSDWNHRELALLGDINVAMSVEIYDNGVWSTSDPHFREYGTQTLEGYLLFTPGLLLNTGKGFKGQSPDFTEVVSAGQIDQMKYNQAIERRMLPLFVQANEHARHDGKPAFITLPGIGCGAFAGIFKGQMGEL